MRLSVRGEVMINPLLSQALSQQPDLALVEGDSAGGPWMSPALPATATATKGAAEEGAGGRKWQPRGNGVLEGGAQLQIWSARQTRGSEIATASVQGKEGAKSGRGSSAPQRERTVGEGREKPGGLSCPGVASKHQIHSRIHPRSLPSLPPLPSAVRCEEQAENAPEPGAGKAGETRQKPREEKRRAAQAGTG